MARGAGTVTLGWEVAYGTGGWYNYPGLGGGLRHGGRRNCCCCCCCCCLTHLVMQDRLRCGVKGRALGMIAHVGVLRVQQLTEAKV